MPYGEYDPIVEESMKWLDKLKEKGFKSALYSNATRWKVEVITRQTDMFCVHRAMKPLPLKLKACLKYLDMKKDKVVIIGDQLFTDLWNAARAGRL